jgi:hypothetical protein
MGVRTVFTNTAMAFVVCAEDTHDHVNHVDEPRSSLSRWEYEGAFVESIPHKDRSDHNAHEGQHTHEHGDVLLLSKGKIKIQMHEGHAKQELTWADSKMAVLILPIATADHHGIKAVEDKADELWGNALATRTNLKLTYPMADGISLQPKVVYELTFDVHTFITAWPIQMNTSYAIFAQHDLAEFQMRGADHVMKNYLGEKKIEAAKTTVMTTGMARTGFIQLDLRLFHDGEEWVQWFTNFAVGALVACCMCKHAHDP